MSGEAYAPVLAPAEVGVVVIEFCGIVKPCGAKVNVPIGFPMVFFTILIEPSWTTGAVTLNILVGVEVPPAVVTLTAYVVEVAIYETGICTWMVVAVIEVGVNAGKLPKFTLAPAIKLVPIIVRVKAALPAVAEVGLIEVTVGRAGTLITRSAFAWSAIIDKTKIPTDKKIFLR